MSWPSPYFVIDSAPSNTLRIKTSFSGVTLSGNKPGQELKYGTLLVGEEERVWFRKADRSSLFSLVTFWPRPLELHASVLRLHPRIDVFLEPYSRLPEFVLYFPDQSSAHSAFRHLSEFSQLLPPRYDTVKPAPISNAIRGVGFIEQTQKKKLQEESKLTLEAFSGDLRELQTRAQVVLDLVRRCAEQLQVSGKNDQDAFDGLLADIGVVANPVSKNSSGKTYHALLSAEIERFLLQKQGTTNVVISLPDVYALYNRARGGAGLVSPLDFQVACELMTSGEFVFVEFEASGVKCLKNRAQYDRISDACENAAASNGFVLVSDLVRALPSLSMIIAKEWMKEQEGSGALVRDVDEYGNVAWFENRFDSYLEHFS